MFSGKIGYHDFDTLFINDNSQDKLLSDMAGKNAMILKNHGLISVGKSITEAFWFHYYLETSCKIHVLTMSTGGIIKYPSADVVKNTAAKYDLWRNANDHITVSDSELLFDAAKRKVGYIFDREQ
jgi:ribulose-5-phosphate 4-epimerase/fuculose-1-phosphate aldolase